MSYREERILASVILAVVLIVCFAIQRDPEYDQEVKAQEPEFISGMPCENEEAHRIWEEWYEQETKAQAEKENRKADSRSNYAGRHSEAFSVNYRSITAVQGINPGGFGGTELECGADQETAPGNRGTEEGGEVNEQAASEEVRSFGGLPDPEVTYQSGTECEANTEVCSEYVQNGVAEDQPMETLQAVHESEPLQTESCVLNYSNEDLLRFALRDAGIEWWYPYGWAQCQQESHWNPYAENANGLDKGLFQYRITYWTEPESIFDVNAQIRRYVREVSARLNAGLSIEETISRHFTSDYVTEINWQYVQDVLQHLQ